MTASGSAPRVAGLTQPFETARFYRCNFRTIQQENTMFARTTLAAILVATSAVALVSLQGCAVSRGQETVGAYVDDAAITTAVKARFIDNKDVDAGAIKVETLNGTVMLSGFAKNATERTTAESIARNVNGVKSVKNEIAIRP
jgi:hyperosmotically inducible protein